MVFPDNLIKRARSIDVQTDAMEASRCMENWNIGSLIVVDEDRPVGIVTDRDIALTVLCNELDPGSCSIKNCMNDELVTIRDNAGVSDAIDLMRRNGIRRLPVVDGEGRLAGIIASDDLVLSLATELAEFASIIRTELSHESLEQYSRPTRLGTE